VRRELELRVGRDCAEAHAEAARGDDRLRWQALTDRCGGGDVVIRSERRSSPVL
jgi:hypothetical protein